MLIRHVTSGSMLLTKSQSEAQKKIVEKRKATLELKEVVAKKKALLSEMQSEIN